MTIDEERQLLGQLILDPTLLDHIPKMLLKPQSFNNKTHRFIFNVLRDMYGLGIEIDLATIEAYLYQREILDLAGGMGYIIGIARQALGMDVGTDLSGTLAETRIGSS